MIWKHIGYTMNEALGYGVPIVTTPLSILKELPITDNEHLVCNWDMSNVDEIVKQIFEKEVRPFEYIPPKDEWDKLLAEGKSTYKEEKEMRFLVEATDKYTRTNTSDNGLSAAKGKRYVPKEGEQWEVDYERKETLVELGFVTVVKEIKEEVIEEAIIEESAIISEEEAEELKESEVAEVKAKKVTVEKTTNRKKK